MKSVKKISSLIGLTLLMGGALVSVPFISTSCGSGEKLTSITITNKTALSDKYELPVNQEINPTPKLIVKDNNGKKVHPTFTCSTLPTGLKIDQTSGQISGRPTVVTINPTKICTITAKYGSFSDNVKITIEIVEAPTSIDLADFTSSNTFENAVLTFNTSFVPSSNTNRWLISTSESTDSSNAFLSIQLYSAGFIGFYLGNSTNHVTFCDTATKKWEIDTYSFGTNSWDEILYPNFYELGSPTVQQEKLSSDFRTLCTVTWR